MTRVIGVLTLVFVLCRSGQAVAQDPATPMDPVVVTATKTETPVGQTGASVSVLTREQIEQRQATDVLQMLREQPGFSLIQSGGRGGTTSIFTRGGNSDMNLVLIDGMKVNQGGGTFDFANITTVGIGRVEIVEDQQQRLHGRRTLEDASDRLEQVETRRVGLAGGSGGYRGDSKALGETRDQLGDMGRSRPQPGGEVLLVAVLGEGADHLRPRPERRCAPALPAATPQDPGPSLDRAVCKVLRERRLADPRLPSDQEQATPSADRVLQAGQQLRRFPVPAHKGPRPSTPVGIPRRNHRAGQPNAKHHRPEPLVRSESGRVGVDRRRVCTTVHRR